MGTTMKQIHLKELKKNQKFYERFYDEDFQFIALEDAYLSGELETDGKKFPQWKCLCKCISDNKEIEFLVTGNHEHYGPKLHICEEFGTFADLIKKYEGYNLELFKVTKLESLNEVSKRNEIHNDYWVVGTKIKEAEISKRFGIVRIVNSKNPNEETSGIFWTSPVVGVECFLDYQIIETKNSKYKVEKLKQ